MSSRHIKNFFCTFFSFCLTSRFLLSLSFFYYAALGILRILLILTLFSSIIFLVGVSLCITSSSSSSSSTGIGLLCCLFYPTNFLELLLWWLVCELAAPAAAEDCRNFPVDACCAMRAKSYYRNRSSSELTFYRCASYFSSRTISQTPLSMCALSSRCLTTVPQISQSLVFDPQ